MANVQASINPNNEKKIKNEDEISKLIKAFPKDNEDSFSNMRTILPAEIIYGKRAGRKRASIYYKRKTSPKV